MALSQIQWKPLDGVRVVDLADAKADYCSKLLADLGAEVIKVEPPGGDSSRLTGPFYQDEKDAEHSLSFSYKNAGKLGITLDLNATHDRGVFQRLTAASDIVVESFPPGYLAGLGLGYEALSTTNAGLIMASVTGYGQTGPHSGYKSCDLTASAAGGQMYVSGRPDKAPLKPFGNQSYYLASLFAATGVLLALRFRGHAGKGQYIDISLQEAVASALEHVLVQYFFDDTVPCRQGTLQWNCASDIFPCRDKFALLTFSREWDTLVELLTSQQVAADLGHTAWRDEEFRRLHIDNIQEVLSIWTCTQDGKSLFELGQSFRFPWGIVNAVDDVAKNEQLLQRGFFLPSQDQIFHKEFTVPGPVIRESSQLPYLWKREPKIGEHNGKLGSLMKRKEPGPQKSDGEKPISLPLAGVRVLDFTWMLAGPYATRMLADFGAEVIKVQSHRVATGAERNDSGYFAAWNRNKLGITLDLGKPEAKEVVFELARKCDVIMENFTPRVMDNWGLGYDKLKEINPGLVMVSLSGFGHSGPWKDYAALGPTLQALSGLTSLTSYDVGRPYGIGLAYADHISGLYAALAVLSALQHRDKTGTGSYIDLSEYEAACSLLGPELMDYSLSGRIAKPNSNRPGFQSAAPHGCYRCRGEDRWIAIAVFTDDEWKALSAAMGDPSWALKDEFQTVRGRQENADELDELIGNWTGKHIPQRLVKILQEAGVTAAAVSDADDLVNDPQLEARGFSVEMDHPSLGKIRADGNPVRLSASPARYAKAAPLLGEDNDKVFLKILGMDEKKYRQYVEAGIIA